MVAAVGEDEARLDVDSGVVVMGTSIGREQDKTAKANRRAYSSAKEQRIKSAGEKSARLQNSSRRETGPQREAINETCALQSAVSRSESEA